MTATREDARAARAVLFEILKEQPRPNMTQVGIARDGDGYCIVVTIVADDGLWRTDLDLPDEIDGVPIRTREDRGPVHAQDEDD